MKTEQIATNKTFQVFAIIEALQLISNDTGISYDSLFKQFPTNKDLQETVASIVVNAAKELSI